MSNDNSPPPTPSSATSNRRASFSPGQSFSELFGRSPSTSGGPKATGAHPGSIYVAAANAQSQTRRRGSISMSLGLTGNSPTQTSPFSNGRSRGESVSSSVSGSTGMDENAIEEGDAVSSSPHSPFARRMSFGARALRDVRGASGNPNGRASSTMASSPTTKGRGLSSSTSIFLPSEDKSNKPMRQLGEGFNWSESLRSRAERTSSVNVPAHAGSAIAQSHHQRATSIATMEPPVQEMPKTPKAPDPFQERILKGDFYMD
ncbi:MAG: hypothetical protein M1827_003013 [Pycnora praestabilis]|nr:MAG: hypothetical protein M1827_003013 [Pycnora praestabilis]